jgi:hypothetical protein
VVNGMHEQPTTDVFATLPSRRHWLAGLLLAIAVTSSACGRFVWGEPENAVRPQQPAATPTPTPAPEPAPPAAAPTAPPAVEKPAPRPSSASSGSRARATAKPVDLKPIQPETPPAIEPAPALAVAMAAPPPPASPEAPAVSPEAAAALAAVRAKIYSKDDTDVIPAKLLTTREGGRLFQDVVADMNTMELIVSSEGRVESVRLLTTPKRMTDMLLLSGAKTWSFQPALKDGTPVRYRTVFSWETVK